METTQIDYDPVADRAVQTLAWGFRVAATLLAVGVILSFARRDPLASTLPSFTAIFDEVGDFRGSGFIGLAIFAIVITPVVTTLSIGVAFLRLGNRRYGMLTLVVLAILAFSIAWSQR
jgi:uncharacterized membrane protein